MKKSVMLMAGMLAVALAGSAQAATMFAVQDSTGQTDMATISDLGEIGASKLSISLSNAPGYVAGVTVAQGNLHAATSGNAYSNAAMLLQHAATPAVTTPSILYSGSASPNFSFYRINKNDTVVPATYSLPVAGASLGFFNFGTLNMTKDPNDPLYRKNTALMFVNAEPSTTNTDAWTATGGINNTPSYFSWWTASNASVPGVPVNNVLAERMRLSSAGNLGIGTGSATPTSKLQVVGLPYFASNTTALAGGLTAGAFYKCIGNGATAYVSPTDTASQALCVVY